MFTRKRQEEPPRTIALLTDFGLADPYVGQMKGVLAKKAPACPVVDISHDVAPFNVVQAGFFWRRHMSIFHGTPFFLPLWTRAWEPAGKSSACKSGNGCS